MQPTIPAAFLEFWRTALSMPAAAFALPGGPACCLGS